MSSKLSFSVLISSLVLQGCQAKGVLDQAEHRLPLPTSEEVALVNQQAYSLSDFYYVRSSLNQPNSQSAVWVGIAALALKQHTAKRGASISNETALFLARYAINDITLAEAIPHLRQFTPSPWSHLPSSREVKSLFDEAIQTVRIQKNDALVSITASLR